MTRRLKLCLAAVAASGVVTVAGAQGRLSHISAVLEGRQEVPAGLTAAKGRFAAEVDPFAQRIDYSLAYDGLEGTITQAHIHIAQRRVNGGIMVWLCGTATNPGPEGTPTCPQSGTVEGTLRPANVLAVTAQGVQAGNFADLLTAIRDGLAYANVHTNTSPGGEIRGQVHRGAAGGVKF